MTKATVLTPNSSPKPQPHHMQHAILRSKTTQFWRHGQHVAPLLRRGLKDNDNVCKYDYDHGMVTKEIT